MERFTIKCTAGERLFPDNVLFAAHNRFHPANRFALVHLTWNAETDARWPSTGFFDSFEAFREQQMYPDAFDYDT